MVLFSTRAEPIAGPFEKSRNSHPANPLHFDTIRCQHLGGFNEECHGSPSMVPLASLALVVAESSHIE
jgi:hypothetical protein